MPRYFTLEEATALLPRLTQIVSAMQERKRVVEELRDELIAAAARARGDGLLAEKELAEKRRAVEEEARRLEEMAREISELGCELKGIDEGLIDFRAQREGREVYLCWRVGEERVAYWHELDTGYAGRQPL